MSEAIYRLFFERFLACGEAGGKEASGLLSVATPAGACLLLPDGAATEGDISTVDCEEGDKGGVKGSGVLSGGRESGLWALGSVATAGVTELLHSSEGTGTFRASAMAIVMAEAVGKRASGSLTMLFRMTADSSGGICGLMRAGGVGIS